MGLVIKAVGSMLIMGSVLGLSFIGSQYASKLDVANELLKANGDLAKAKAEIEKLEEAKQQLAMANRLLKVNYLLAKVHLKTQYKEKDTGKLISVIEFCEVDDQENPLARPQEYHIRGSELHIEGLVAKFEDEFVEAGDPRRGTALFAFRRLYGDDEAASGGYVLPTNRSQPGAYAQGGLPTKLEEKFWTNFWSNAHDEAWMKDNGLRALHGEAGIIQLREGYEYRVKLGARGDFTIESRSAKARADVLNSARQAKLKSWQGD
jgi:hypothetical protein